jgi:replicative DNA helicase
MKEKLSKHILVDIFKASLLNRNFYTTILPHLQSNYISDESQKKVWNAIQRQYKLSNGKPITMGVLKNQLSDDDLAIDVLLEINEVQIDDFEILLVNFEKYIKDKSYIELLESSASLFNKGDKDRAFDLVLKGSEKISNFKILNTFYEKLFEDFVQRQSERESGLKADSKIKTGIDELDHYIYGGFEKTDSVLFLGDSGVGKSQLLIHLGIAASRRGLKVAHFQAEGTRRQCMDRYDSAWTGTMYNDMKIGQMDVKKYKACKLLTKKIEGEIYVDCFEKFGTKSIVDVRNSIIEMKKMYGNIDVVILDYLELVDVGDGRTYSPSEERLRQQAIGRAIKNIAVEQNVLFYTATQASSIDTKDLNDPDFVITRYNLSEDKGKLRPFDALITINQTRDEQKKGFARLFNDKLREYKSGQTMTILQSLSHARFYDRKKTLDYLADTGEGGLQD